MFATLHGGYPVTDPGDAAPSDRVGLIERVITDQLDAGLGLLTDGGVHWPDPGAAIMTALGGPERPSRSRPLSVDDWTATASVAADVPVKQCLPGPYTLGRQFAASEDRRHDLTLALADAIAPELVDLAAVGCPFIQVDEDAAVRIGTDEAERRLFIEAHERLTAGLDPRSGSARPHLSLAIVGGNVDTAGDGTIFGPPYDSYLFDLIAGPDNWRLIAVAPPERGIVLGVVDPGGKQTEPAVIVWAVGYAASSAGRGEQRIGIATTGSLAGMARAAARGKIELLGSVVDMIEHRHERPIAAALDPRAFEARSAGWGRWTSERDPTHPGAG